MTAVSVCMTAQQSWNTQSSYDFLKYKQVSVVHIPFLHRPHRWINTIPCQTSPTSSQELSKPLRKELGAAAGCPGPAAEAASRAPRAEAAAAGGARPTAASNLVKWENAHLGSVPIASIGVRVGVEPPVWEETTTGFQPQACAAQARHTGPVETPGTPLCWFQHTGHGLGEAGAAQDGRQRCKQEPLAVSPCPHQPHTLPKAASAVGLRGHGAAPRVEESAKPTPSLDLFPRRKPLRPWCSPGQSCVGIPDLCWVGFVVFGLLNLGGMNWKWCFKKKTRTRRRRSAVSR